MSVLQNDKDVLKKRTNILKDDKTQDLQVTASLRDQQLEKLAAKLEKLNVGQKISEMWQSANSDRTEWLERRSAFLQEVDEFIDPIYNQALDWSSTLHLPTILTVCKTYHSRMYAALIGIDPPFTVRARKGANMDRALLVEDLLRYTLKDWCNENEGIEDAVDRWLWDWVTQGVGILKSRWNRKFTRFMDVEEQEVPDVDLEMDPETGDSVPVPIVRRVEREVERTEEVFNGPMLTRVPIEDLVIVGGEGDPQKADYVIEQSWFTASELWSLVDQKVFRDDAVKKTIYSGKDSVNGTDETGAIKQDEKQHAGMSSMEKEHATDRYHILEAYVKMDIDGSGIAQDLIVWIHKNSREILRATYLRRVNKTGTIPYFKIDFHHRHGTEYGVGLIELLYSLGKEIDAIHNMKMDIGILSSMPFGFYKPTSASIKEERMPLEPGILIPVSDPQSDVFFPNLGMRTAFGFQEEAALMNQIERLTSISDINLGVVGGQGATRTATGTRALLGEASNNLNIYIQRMNRGWKRALRYIFTMVQDRIQPGFQFRILGDDGNSYWETVKSKEEIAGMYDFELEGNSANSNKQIQMEQANMLVMMTQNPIDLQLGIISPSERYEALAYQLKVSGIKDVSKFLRKPDQVAVKFAPIEIIDRILSGVDVRLDPTQDLQGLVQLIEEFKTDESLNGQMSPNHMAILEAKQQEAVALLQALQQAQAQNAAISQQQLNANAGMQPGNLQPANISTDPGQGEGAA